MKTKFNNSHLVFLYCDLRTGHANNLLLVDSKNGLAKKVIQARTVVPYPLIQVPPFGDCPMLDVPNIGQHVFGEIWRVDNFMLEFLFSFFEVSHPNGFRPKAMRVYRMDRATTEQVIAFVYPHVPEVGLDEQTLHVEVTAKMAREIIPQKDRPDTFNMNAFRRNVEVCGRKNPLEVQKEA